MRARFLWLAVALAVCLGAVWPVDAPAQVSKRARARFLRDAEMGVRNARKFWWGPGIHWFRSSLHGHDPATLWQILPLFETLDGIAIAAPTHRNEASVRAFAFGAERYLDSGQTPLPGFTPQQGEGPQQTAWFDDNGWWGNAFLDAYRATPMPQFLAYAETAQLFISASGWDSSPGSPGGLWWNTNRTFYAGETFASATLLSARLYRITGVRQYLDDALKFIAWGDKWLWDAQDGLYARLRTPAGEGMTSPASVRAARQAAEQRALAANPSEAAKLSAGTLGSPRLPAGVPTFDPTPMPYVQGPMILAFDELCQATQDPSYCLRANYLAQNSANRFRRWSMGPQFDAVYARDMLVHFESDRNPRWYGIGQGAARLALKKAVDRGPKKKKKKKRKKPKAKLYTRTWYGAAPGWAGAGPGSLQLHAATVSLFAWLGATR